MDLEAEVRRLKNFLNVLADNDSYIWRTIRQRPVSISAFIQNECHKAIRGE